MQREVAGFWRPLRILGGSEHRREIPFQLDLQSWLAEARVIACVRRRLTLVRRQDDGVDKATKRLRGFRADFWMLKGLSQSRDLLAVQAGHLRVQERRRRVSGCQFCFQFLASDCVRVQLVLHFGRRHAVHHHLDQLLSPDLDALDLALGGRQARSMFHPKPVHLARELVAELLEEVLAQ
ncbi:MAG: hypothetical protein ABL971_05105 [Vicinamibacterales bacterium]